MIQIGYCTVSDVRLLSNLTTTDISDSDVISLIGYATAELNRQINTTVEKINVEYINSTKRNTIDGSNTTFSTDHWPLGDYNNDGALTTADLHVYNYTSDGIETEVTVSSINADSGQFVLTTAPASGTTLRITYAYAPVLISEDTVHPLIKMACAQLVNALSYTKVDSGKLERFRLGKLEVMSGTSAGGAKSYYSQYNNTIRLINARIAQIVEGEGYEGNTESSRKGYSQS